MTTTRCHACNPLHGGWYIRSGTREKNRGTAKGPRPTRPCLLCAGTRECAVDVAARYVAALDGERVTVRSTARRFG